MKTTKLQDEEMKLAYYQWQSYAQIDKIFRISLMSVYSRFKGHIEAKKKIVSRWQINQLHTPFERLVALQPQPQGGEITANWC